MPLYNFSTFFVMLTRYILRLILSQVIIMSTIMQYELNVVFSSFCPQLSYTVVLTSYWAVLCTAVISVVNFTLMSSKSLCPGPHYHELQIFGLVQVLQTPHHKSSSFPPLCSYSFVDLSPLILPLIS